MRILTPLILIITIMSACVIPNRYPAIAPGVWRGVLKLDNQQTPKNTDAKPENAPKGKFEEVTEGELPFIFEMEYDENENLIMTIQNGTERIITKEITLNRNPKTGDDTIFIDFPHYDSYIQALYEVDAIEGHWVVKSKKDYRIPFVAKHGNKYRFTALRKTPKIDVNGQWEVTFGTDTDNPYTALGEFQQDGNTLTGTFLTETGDYRFLEGTIQDNKMYLSCFDGSHAFLFEAKILEDNTLLGQFRSGSHYTTMWTAKRNPNFKLGNPDSLTYIKEGYDKIAFSFPNTKGEMVSLEDEGYKGKVKIVQILGTWCPNCVDETNFLVDYLKENPSKDLEIIGLAYEKYKETDRADKAINRFKERLEVPYEILRAGYANKKEASQTLPMLNRIISYPTMIFIDKKGEVRRIHTGFMGPATSRYKDFKTEFKTFIEQLLAE